MKHKSLISLLSASLLLFPSCGRQEKEHRIDAYSSIREVGHLELARMTVGKIGMISDPDYREARSLEEKARAVFSNMKIGTRVGVYSYDTYVVAYIDLSALRPEDVEIDSGNGVARVWLPPVEIMTDGREPQLHEEHARVTGLRSSITPSERAALKAQMSKEVRKELSESDGAAEAVRKAAEEKGKAWLSELLENWGYRAEINFRK